jgi:hypothetical protein
LVALVNHRFSHGMRTGASAAELPGGGLAPTVLTAPEPVVKAVRSVPRQVKDAALAPQAAKVSMPERRPEVGARTNDFGPFGALSAQNTRPDETAMNALGGAVTTLSALTG